MDAQLSLFSFRQLLNSLFVLVTASMPETLDRSLSSVSLNSIPEDDWDRSLPDIKDNSIVFPVNETPGKSSRYSHSKTASVQDGKGDRNLSELLRFHLEENSKGHFSAEEAARIADVLGQWVGVHSYAILNVDPDPV